MRLFAALDLPERERGALALVRDEICRADRSWCDQKWVAPENLHVTIAFFGDVPDADVERVISQVGEAAERLAPPVLDDVRLLATPNARRARMIWAEWRQANDSAAALSAELTERLPEYAPTAHKAFRAHATLCRARDQRALRPEALEQAEAAITGDRTSMSVPVVSVISSRLTPRGPVYATIGTRHFGGE